MAELTLNTRLATTSAVIAATGEIDVYQAPRLRDAIDGLPPEAVGPLVIDLSGVTYIDSTGLGTLVAVRKRRLADGSEVRLVCPDPALRKVFEITGLISFFPMLDSVDAALAADTESI